MDHLALKTQTCKSSKEKWIKVPYSWVTYVPKFLPHITNQPFPNLESNYLLIMPAILLYFWVSKIPWISATYSIAELAALIIIHS